MAGISILLFVSSCTKEDPKPEAVPVATATPASTVITSGTTASIALKSDVTTATFSWTVSQNGVTGASDGSGTLISHTLNASGDAQGTVTYVITPQANGIKGNPVSVTITVNPLKVPVVTATAAAQAIDSGTATSIALKSDITPTSFSWTVIQDGVTGASEGSGTSIAQTLNASGTVAGTVIYVITPEANGIKGTPVSVTITVNPIMKTTYLADVKQIFTTSCAPCHMASGYNSVKLDNYAVAKSKITNIIDRIERTPGTAGFMPQGGTKLSDANIATLKKWLADGLAEK